MFEKFNLAEPFLGFFFGIVRTERPPRRFGKNDIFVFDFFYHFFDYTTAPRRVKNERRP